MKLVSKRNGSIELYRCLLMLGICFIHSFGVFNTQHSLAPALLLWCVTAYAFISGYYGIRFSLVKVLRLYTLAFWCCLVASLAECLFVGDTWGISGVIGRAWHCLCRRCWFLHAYMFMMCMAPMANAAVKSCGRSRMDLVWMVLPALLLVYGWSYALGLPGIRSLPLPRDTSLGDPYGYSGMSLFGAYLAARVFKELDFESLLSTRVLMIVLPFSFIPSLFGVSYYNSVFALIVACVTFTLFLRLPEMKTISRISAFLAPSMFAVYLLHVSFDWEMIKRFGSCFSDSTRGVCLGLTIFLVCCVADLFRRAILFVLFNLNNTRRRVLATGS